MTARPVLGGRPLAIRIGLHFGQVLEEESDVFGDAVNVAARLVADAKGGQILTSRPTLAAAGPEQFKASRLVDIATVRGRQQPVEIFECLWQASDTTQMRHPPPPATPEVAAILVLPGGGRLELGAARPAVTIGRSDQNDVLLEGSLVSRLHARIEVRRGRCILTDQSTNGTYVMVPPGVAVFVRHDSQALVGTGLLGFGQAPAEGAPTTLRYLVPGAA